MTQDIHSEPCGELKISAPISFSELHLMPAISDFANQYPDISIKMSLTDRVVDIVEEGFDLALRIGSLSDSSLIARRLFTIRTVACASYDYLEKYGQPHNPKDLLEHSCIIDTNYKDGVFWDFKKEGDKYRINLKGQYFVNSAIAVKELAVAHHGIAMCPIFAAGETIKSNQLKVILPKYKIEEYGLYALYPHRRYLSAKVRLFIALLKEYFSSLTEQHQQEWYDK